ncbi:MAG: hypothetical protein GY863_10175 [bacterium]|nr:hypothetical protein [bacterium]
MNSENESTFSIKYTFQLKNDKREFDVRIDKTTLDIVLPEIEKIPKWVNLDFYQCSNCPFDKEVDQYCPAALSMIDVIVFFSDFISFTEADITVEMEDCTHQKHTSLQNGISSLIGLIMATSGCPILGKLKPMARFHRPFASADETVFRAMSTYLLAQYFRKLHGDTPDWDLENLEKFYNEIHTVNKDFALRLKHIHIHDASLNALNILDTFANFILMEIHRHVLKEFKLIMMEYFID